MIIRKAAVNNFDEALKLVKKTGCNKYADRILAAKALINPVVIEKIDNRAAAIFKQEALSCGADLAVNENVSRFKKGFSDAVLLATVQQMRILSVKLGLQPFGLKEAAAALAGIAGKLTENKKVFRYKNKKIDLLKPAVMGIVNLDPSSFSGDGLTDAGKAAKQAEEFERLGASIIDVGAQSTRPGVKPVDSKTELKRLLPALKQIRKKVKIPISIDTYKFETAKAALSEGADIINDIFALRKGGDKLAKLIAGSKAGLILMHMKGVPSTMQKNPSYKDCVSQVYKFLKERKDYALQFGIKEDYISVDPGAGFGKTFEHNMELIKNMGVFSSLGAVTAGVSRKSFVRSIAGAGVSSFVAANFLAVLSGADIIRAHDVEETVNALNLIDVFRRV